MSQGLRYEQHRQAHQQKIPRSRGTYVRQSDHQANQEKGSNPIAANLGRFVLKNFLRVSEKFLPEDFQPNISSKNKVRRERPLQFMLGKNERRLEQGISGRAEWR